MKKIISVLIIAVMLAANCMSVNCFAADEWIYYSNSKDINRPYRIKSDGTKITRLSLETAYDLTPFGNYIYYHNNSDLGGILRTKNDGSETEIIADGIRNYFRGIAHNGSNVFILYETNYNVGDCEYVEPDLTLCIYDKKGECTYFKYAYMPYCQLVGADSRYLYLAFYKNGKINEYKKILIKKLSEKNFEKCTAKDLPKAITAASDMSDISNKDYFRNRFLSWEKFEGAEKYKIYKKNNNSGKYKLLSETSDTSADICILNSEYNDEIKISALKENKLYNVKINETSYSNKITDGNMSNSPFAVSHDNYVYISDNKRIYKTDTKTGKKTEIWNGDDISDESARFLNLYEDKLFFFGRYSDLCCIDTDGNNIDIMPYFCKSIGTEPDDLNDHNFEIHSIAVYSGMLYVSYHLEKDNDFEHTAAFDIKNMTSHKINDLPVSQPGFAENKIIFISDNDRRIYSTSQSSKETVCISEQTALSMYIDNENNKLYYCNEKGIFMSEIDGTNCKKIYDGDVKAVNSDGKKLYFIRDDLYRENYVWNSKYTAWSIEFDGKYPEMITDVSGDGGFMSLNIIGDRMYVLYSADDVYSYSIKK